MHTWFQCKVKYERNVDDGSIAKVSETYLIDALSFTEAEERINEEMKPYISGDFMVTDIKRAKINELFENESGDRWYRSKVNFVSLDEEKGIEKRIKSLCPQMNILSLDFDSSVSDVNITNRLLLFIDNINN